MLEMDGQLDSHYIQFYESKNEKVHFARIDSDIIDNLIRKEEQTKMSLTDLQQQILQHPGGVVVTAQIGGGQGCGEVIPVGIAAGGINARRVVSIKEHHAPLGVTVSVGGILLAGAPHLPVVVGSRAVLVVDGADARADLRQALRRRAPPVAAGCG